MKIKTLLFIQLSLVGLLISNSCKKDSITISKKTPIITWTNPSDIGFGTPLSAKQLNATANVAGTFVYTPTIGTVLNEGPNQILKVDFFPSDTVYFNKANQTVIINVVPKINPVITWSNPVDVVSGTPLSATQLNATANVAGTFVYTPAIGTVLTEGVSQNLKVDFTPSNSILYNTATKTVTINAVKANVGDNYQGGKIAYIFQVGDPGYIAGQTHGLIAATSDQDAGCLFFGNSSPIEATGTALGTGAENTRIIISIQGSTDDYAAKICRDYAGGGYHDWYLPSKDELSKLFINRVAIGGFACNLFDYKYWSSSLSISGTLIWCQSFNNGEQATYFDSYGRVRAVRSF